MNNETFANQLRTMRTRAGWSRAKMHDQMGVPQRTIEDWEAGKRTPPEYVQRLVLDRLDAIIALDRIEDAFSE